MGPARRLGCRYRPPRCSGGDTPRSLPTEVGVPCGVQQFSLVVAGLVVVLAAASSCAPRRSPAPPPSDARGETTPAPANDACIAIRARILAEVCGDEPDCDSSALACEQRLDLDGDGRMDRVDFATAGDEPVLRVTFGDGETRVLTDPFAQVELPDLGSPWPADAEDTSPASVSWLVAWSVAKREGDRLVRGSSTAAGPALGDGLWMSGEDAAAMLILTAKGWWLVELGY